MSSFLCFICHSTVNADTSEETREKYREVVGINNWIWQLYKSYSALILRSWIFKDLDKISRKLCPDSQLCHICCHVLNKLSMFRSICLKRSLEYPVLFSEKGTINLQRSDIEILHIVCPDDMCDLYDSHKAYNCKTYHFTYNSHDDYIPNDNYNDENQYVALEDKFNDYFNPVNPQYDDELPIETVNEEVIEEFNNEINDTAAKVKELVTNNDFLAKVVVENDHTRINEFNNEINDAVNVKIDTNNDSLAKVDNDGIDESLNIFNDKSNTDVTQENNIDYDSNDESFLKNDDNEENYEYNDTDNIDNSNDIDPEPDIDTKKDKIKDKRKKKTAKKILLSVEEQKAELEARRKEKKYLEAEFKCYNCALPFLFKDTYQAHMMRHEESNGEYKCPICTLRFASQAVLRSHSLVHARRCGCGSTQRRCGCDSAARPRQRVACHLCGNMLKDANGLQQHLRRVHMSKSSNRLHSCNVCGERFPGHAALRTHMIKHIKRKFYCELCTSVYSSPYTLARHRLRHTAPASEGVRCECGVQCRDRRALLAHRRTAMRHRTHLLECPICTKACPNQRSLVLHMQAIHSGTKDHACPHCDARYSTRPSLLRHIASHTRKPQPKTAVCHLCGSTFKDKSKLNRHLKNVCEKARLEEQLASLYE